MLRYLASRLSGPELATAFGRTYGAVKMKAAALGVSIARRHESAHTETIPAQSPAVLRRVVEIINGQLCPACAKRAIGHKAGELGVSLAWQSFDTALTLSPAVPPGSKDAQRIQRCPRFRRGHL